MTIFWNIRKNMFPNQLMIYAAFHTILKYAPTYVWFVWTEIVKLWLEFKTVFWLRNYITVLTNFLYFTLSVPLSHIPYFTFTFTFSIILSFQDNTKSGVLNNRSWQYLPVLKQRTNRTQTSWWVTSYGNFTFSFTLALILSSPENFSES